MIPHSRQDHEQKLVQLASEAFDKHVIRSCDFVMSEHTTWPKYPHDWSFILARPGSGTYLAEIRLVYGGRVLVHGDIAGHLFEGNRSTVMEALEWIGASDPSYIVDKVRLGAKETTSDEVAIWELQRFVDEERERRAPDPDDPDGETENETEMSVAYREAIEIIKNGGGVAEARRHVYEETGDGEAGWFGKVIDSDLFYSMAACRKLLSLLQEQEIRRCEELGISGQICGRPAVKIMSLAGGAARMYVCGAHVTLPGTSWSEERSLNGDLVAPK